MLRDRNWEKFWSTGSVFDYLAYRKTQENKGFPHTCCERQEPCLVVKPAAACVVEAKNEIDHSGSDSKGTDRRRKG